jgi:hypothetical protein
LPLSLILFRHCCHDDIDFFSLMMLSLRHAYYAIRRILIIAALAMPPLPPPRAIPPPLMIFAAISYFSPPIYCRHFSPPPLFHAMLPLFR